MAFPLIVSFFTQNTPYEEEVKNLVRSCHEFGLESCVEGVDSFGSWELNCAFKPFFLCQKLQELKRPLFWVDADGVFLEKPTLLPLFSCDFATRIHEELPLSHPSKVISSTIYINNTQSALEILRRWAQESMRQLMQDDRKEEFWDQTALRDVLFGKKLSADIRSLPLSLTKISGHPLDEQAAPHATLEHYQASRRFKNMV